MDTRILNEKTNSELTCILRWCSDADIRNNAWKVLAEKIGIKPEKDEETLIKEIAKSVLERPGSLNMGRWHCGTSHCLAGWATVLDNGAMKIEHEHSTEIAGCVALPSYANMFYSDNNTVLEFLKSKIN